MPPQRPDDTLSLGELLAAAAARGAPTTARQAKRLREEGLLRCIDQRHPKGSRGSSSRYAASEVDQLVLVQELGRRERRFDERRVLVAWYGGWVEPEALRDSLVRILDAVSARVGRATEGIEDPAEAADQLTRVDRSKRKPSEAVQLMRHRLDGDATALQSGRCPLIPSCWASTPRQGSRRCPRRRPSRYAATSAPGSIRAPTCVRWWSGSLMTPGR